MIQHPARKQADNYGNKARESVEVERGYGRKNS